MVRHRQSKPYQRSADPSTEGQIPTDADSNGLDLAGSAASAAGHVTVLPPVDPVVNGLGRPMATSFGVFPRSRPLALVEITIVALIAAGALAPDSPVLNHVRRVAPAFTGHRAATSQLPEPVGDATVGLGARGGSRRSRVVGHGGTSDWRHFHQQRKLGLSRRRVPPLPRRASAWQLPGVLFNGLDALAPLSWWAEDHWGNHRAAAPSDRARGRPPGDCAEGAIRFSPALDRRAGELRIPPPTATQRAFCTVSLPRWSPPGRSAWAQPDSANRAKTREEQQPVQRHQELATGPARAPLPTLESPHERQNRPTGAT